MEVGSSAVMNHLEWPLKVCEPFRIFSSHLCDPHGALIIKLYIFGNCLSARAQGLERLQLISPNILTEQLQ